LQSGSIVEGLKNASAQRCDELRNEYKDLDLFFDSLIGFNILTTEAKLQEEWQKTVQNILPDFNKFMDFLLDIGLLKPAKLQGKEQGYRFAEIYTHGFRIYRGTRKY